MSRKTPLFDIHASLGARFVDFAGWEMPVKYTGIIEEHLAVRSACGLFDVSHMGQIEVSGDSAIDFVENIMTNDIERVSDGQCQYSLLCNEKGGVVDDVIVYRFNIDRYLFCVNASNTEKVYRWMQKNVIPDVTIDNVSENYALIALQGPRSAEVLRPLLDVDPQEIRRFHFHMGLVGDAEAIVSRTGYTGEDGFEIYVEPGEAAGVWKALMEAGRPHGLIPAGLGARDSLRIEMGYPLYGHELSDEITPIEAGLDRYVRLEKDFIGKDVLAAQAEKGVGRVLVGFRMDEPGVPRADYEVRSNGKKAGYVSSGIHSPSLEAGVGMAFVEPSLKVPGTGIEIVIRNRAAAAKVARLPLLKK